MNLYSNPVPDGSETLPVHNGFESVYFDELSTSALLTSQFPNLVLDPTTLMLSPYVVLIFALNTTSTVGTGVAQVEGAVVLVGGRGEEPVPDMAISAQLRYTCGVWKLFHLKLNSVWLETYSGIFIFFVTVYPPAMDV